MGAERKPEWLKVRAPGGARYTELKAKVRDLGLATVCEEARCPNIGECWGGGTATIMIMGDTCTRGCRFCNIKTHRTPPPVDPLEPTKVAGLLAEWGLDYVVVTSVDRDDMPDQGAGHFAKTVEATRAACPDLLIEVLIPDFQGRRDLLEVLVASRPHMVAHNVETVERLTPSVRDPRAGYRQSLELLRRVKEMDPTRHTKSSLMLGLGETDDEVLQCLLDLRAVGCDVVTFGQYLQPTPKHLKVEAFITPNRFAQLQQLAEGLGFKYVASGPLVRSSYRAGELFLRGMIMGGGQVDPGLASA